MDINHFILRISVSQVRKHLRTFSRSCVDHGVFCDKMEKRPCSSSCTTCMQKLAIMLSDLMYCSRRCINTSSRHECDVSALIR